MFNYLFQVSVLLLISTISFGQADGCSAATVISVTANCSSPTAGTTTGATQTIPGCTGNADDDVWYQFTATATSTQITVTASASFDPVVQLFSGACASLASLSCQDDFGTAVTETINYSGLTIGQVYRIRVYNYGIGSGSGNFTICVSNPPAAPANDACGGAVLLPVNASCTYTNGTTSGATQSFSGCAGTADDDVWYRFTATNSVQSITVHPLSSLDMVVQVYSGTCGTLNSLICTDNTFSGQDEQVNLVGLVAGQTYYIRVYDYYSGPTGNFQICVTGTPTPAPTNDEPCNAITLPAVTSACQYLEFTTIGATASMSAPTPTACAGGSAPQQGGFSSSTDDVWFAITVPATGSIHITPKPNMGAGSLTDAVMALYSGTCGSLSQIACSDDFSAYPGTVNDLLPTLTASGLTPGTTVYLRYFGYGSSSGTFGLCVTTATNDACANALYICDINGYSAMTSSAYTPDRPGNMHGNNEDINGVNLPDGTNSGGIFGAAGSWGTGAPAFDVIINNNSWIKFTASATTAVLQVAVYNCYVGNYPSGGIQMQIFSGTNCTAFVPVSNFEENSTGFTITANNLTVGSDYYLMVDGYAGDICGYTITAQSGVQFPDIANVPAICVGQSTTLTAPPGATSYEWEHNGATTQSVTVTPGTTQTYYCEVTGLCGFKQTLDVTVQVNPLPIVSITNGPNVSICNGNSVTLTASGAGNYSWSSGGTSSSTTVSPTSTASYTVTGTSLGCTAQATTNVTVNALPTMNIQPSSVNANCGSSNGALTGANVIGAPTMNYVWTNGGGSTVGTSLNLTNIPAGSYFLNAVDGNNCSANFGPFSVINPGAPGAPTIAFDDATPCLNSNAFFTASYSDPSATFTWSGPVGFSSSNSTINFINVDESDQGTYCVFATLAGCSGPSTCQSLTIVPPPVLAISIDDLDSLICYEQDFELTASGAQTYSWSGPDGFNQNGAVVTLVNVDANNEGYYVLNATDNNGCSNSDSILVQIAPLPLISVTNSGTGTIVCESGIISLQANGANTYEWTGPAGFNSTSQNPSITGANETHEGWYTLEGTDVNGCKAADSVLVNIDSNNSAIAAISDSVICPGDPVSLNASGGESYVWSGPNFFNTTGSMVSIASSQISNTGWYTVFSTDENGCNATDSVYLSVENNADCLLIPTLVTPDGNAQNDVWFINGIQNFEKAEVEIYNRWGNQIYYSSPYNNDWDGSVNRGTTIDNEGRVPVGTYFFIIRLNDEENHSFEGYVEVQY
jgi:gliding motility-associated-like protein